MTLALVRVEKRGAEYIPVCRLCGFDGVPRRRPSDARGALANHLTCSRHRRAVRHAAAGAARRPVEA